MHAMRREGQPVQTARERYCAFIERSMRMYNQLKTSPLPGTRRLAYRYLGMAMHAVMDSTSPAHVGFQQWSLAFSEVRRHGSFESSIEDLDVAPRYLGLTWGKMMAVFEGGQLGECECVR
jgi:hypothetical protein